MRRTWTELWSYGIGAARIHCGIARTADGYAVDLFEGDTCRHSERHGRRTDAVRRALALEKDYWALHSGLCRMDAE